MIELIHEITAAAMEANSSGCFMVTININDTGVSAWGYPLGTSKLSIASLQDNHVNLGTSNFHEDRPEESLKVILENLCRLLPKRVDGVEGFEGVAA